MASEWADFSKCEPFTGAGGPEDSWLKQTDFAASDGMLSAWDNLAAHAVEPNVFYESWYLLPALKAYRLHQDVRTFTLWEGTPKQSVLLGLMPIIEHSAYAGLPMPHFQNWLHPNAFLGSPLVRSGYEDLFWRSLLSSLDNQSGRALFLHLNAVNISGPLQQAFHRVCENDIRENALVQTKSRAFLQSELTAQDYYESSVRPKKRKELRRQRNRLSELGDVRFARIHGDAGLQDWTSEFLALELRGWKGGSGSALDCQDDTRALFSLALAGAAQRGKLERLELRLNGAPIAMLVNFLSAPGSFSFKTAFDEDYARFSPGVLLQIENLSLLAREEIDWCDSCAAEGHPMIDSLWQERRQIGRYSVAIGGTGRRMLFSMMLKAELVKMNWRRRGDESAENEAKGQTV